MEEETFVQVPRFPDYEISSLGRVRNTRTGRMMSITRSRSSGWYVVGLTKDKDQRIVYVSRLVAEAFMDPPVEPNTTLLHIDGDRGNNAVSNLIWKPRWFVVRYIKEMNVRSTWEHRPFRSLTTGDVFYSIAEFCMEELMLPSVVKNALTGADPIYFGVQGRIVYC